MIIHHADFASNDRRQCTQSSAKELTVRGWECGLARNAKRVGLCQSTTDYSQTGPSQPKWQRRPGLVCANTEAIKLAARVRDEYHDD